MGCCFYLYNGVFDQRHKKIIHVMILIGEIWEALPNVFLAPSEKEKKPTNVLVALISSVESWIF